MKLALLIVLGLLAVVYGAYFIACVWDYELNHGGWDDDD